MRLTLQEHRGAPDDLYAPAIGSARATAACSTRSAKVTPAPRQRSAPAPRAHGVPQRIATAPTVISSVAIVYRKPCFRGEGYRRRAWFCGEASLVVAGAFIKAGDPPDARLAVAS